MSRSMQQPLSVTLARKLLVFTSSGVINLSLHGTLLLKAALGEHMANTGLRSAVLTVASFATGLGPDAQAAQIALKVLVELIVEAVFIYHQPMTGVASLPFVAIVHALRQSMWMCIVVWALDGDPRQQLKLGACNWTFLVLVSCYFQRYTWAAYRQHSSTQQRLPRPPPLTTVLEGVPGFVTEATSSAEPLSQGPSSSALNRSNTIPYSTQQSGWESEAAGMEMETCSPHPSAPGTPTVTSIGDLLGHYGNTKQGKEWVEAMQRFSDDGTGSDAKHSAQSLYGQAHMHSQPAPPQRQPSGSSGATGSRHGKGHQSQSSTVTATSSNRSSTELGIRFGDAGGQQKPPQVPVETALDSTVPAGDRALDVSVIQSITPVISSEDSDQMGPAAEAARRAVDGPAAVERAVDGPAEARQDSPFKQQSAEAMSDVGTELPPVGPATPGADVTGAAAAEAADQAVGGQPAAARDASHVTEPASTDIPSQEQQTAPATTARAMPLHTQQHVAEAGGDAAIDAAITRRLPSVPHQLEALIRRIDDRRRRPYMRKTDRESKAVHVKINGIELEQLPVDLSGMLHEQLRNGMPGVMMTSMALRSGCVIIALDLLSSPEDGEAAGGNGMADLMSRIMQGHAMGRALEDGATMSIQMPDEITACQWDTDSNGYWVVDEEEGALDPSSLKAYHTISTLPTVISLPETGDDDNDTCRELVFSVELQLPGNCHLYGWQPAGVAAPAGSDVQAQAAGVVDAMLLARRLDGGYLPVVVERVVRVESEGSDASQHTTARLVVTVDDVAPAALCLELWCQAQGTGPPAPDGRIEPGHELLVSHMPLLVLPSLWKEAAEELQQHIVETGGVQPRNALPPSARDVSQQQAGFERQSGCLLEDLGMWLTHPDRVAGTVLSDSAMARLGDDLLVHAVQHGLGAVASMIVDHMPRIEQQGAGNDASPWLRRVSGTGGCGDGDGMNLLHAAMASGSADVLGQLFRWGARFGGPGWSWSWELEASEGLTALHFTASQPEDICRGMLETITRMLPAAQVHAARNAWLHCQGGVSTTPAELWGMAAHGDGVSFMWATEAMEVSSGSLVSKPSSELYNNGTRLAEVATASSTSSGKRSKEHSGSSISSGPIATALSTTRSPSPAAAVLSSRAKVQSWLGSVVEVWFTPETEEYRTWASKQTFQLIHWWVVPLLALSALGMYRSSSEGCVQYELMHLGLHALAYLPIMASARGLSWLGDWQAWMLVTHTLDALGYGAKTFLSVHQASVWAAASSSAVNVCCVVLISAALNQAPRPHLLVACMFMAYFRSLAYQMVGHPHPLRHALVTDAIALGISTLARARQLRAFQAWLAELLDRRNGPRQTATVPTARTKPPYGMAAVRQASGGF